jgi:hypothetical protein
MLSSHGSPRNRRATENGRGYFRQRTGCAIFRLSSARRRRSGAIGAGNVVRKKRADRQNPSLGHVGIDYKRDRKRDGLHLSEILANWAMVAIFGTGNGGKIPAVLCRRANEFVRIFRPLTFRRRFKRPMRRATIVTHAGQEMQSVSRHGNRRKQDQNHPGTVFLGGSVDHCTSGKS